MPTAALTWDEAANRKFEYGVSKVVLFPMGDEGAYEAGVPWNGMINITDNPDGAEVTKLWADNMEYATMQSAEQYHCSAEAYTYPDEYAACDGSAQPVVGMYLGQQKRKKFGLCWRTEIGNANNDALGYKIHVAYGLSATPTEKAHDTVNDSPDAQTFNWDMDGTPVPVTGYKPTAKIEFDSTKLSTAKMTALENLLYGSNSAASQLPLPDAIITALQAAT